MISPTAAAFYLVAAVACASSASAAPKPVQEWLDKMEMAVEGMSYRGTVVFWHDGRLDSLAITHATVDGTVRERILTLNGVPREIVRNNDSVICIMPNDRAVLIDSRLTQRIFPVIPADRVARSGRYEFSLSGVGRVAGLVSQVVDIEPLDNYRYGYRLWLEETTGMLLKSQLLGRKGELIEQLMFTDIEIGAGITDEDFVPTLSAKDYRQISVPQTPEPVMRRPADDRGLVSQVKVPEGFMLSAYNRAKGAGDQLSEHMVFSDGLASVSVYIEPGKKPSSKIMGPTRMGALSAYGTSRGDHRVMVIGDVPASTVKSIATSLQGSAGR